MGHIVTQSVNKTTGVINRVEVVAGAVALVFFKVRTHPVKGYYDGLRRYRQDDASQDGIHAGTGAY